MKKRVSVLLRSNNNHRYDYLQQAIAALEALKDIQTIEELELEVSSAS